MHTQRVQEFGWENLFQTIDKFVQGATRWRSISIQQEILALWAGFQMLLNRCCPFVKLYLTFGDFMGYSMPDSFVLHYLPSLLKFMSIESVMLSNYLILCHPLLLLPSVFPSIRVFSNESTLHIRWPKYWSFSFSIILSNEYSGWISFKIDWFHLLAVRGTLKSLLQHHSSKVSISSNVPRVNSWTRSWRECAISFVLKKKRALEDETAGWHHRSNGHELGQTSGDGEGQRGLVCCSPWSHEQSDMTGKLNNSLTVTKQATLSPDTGEHSENTIHCQTHPHLQSFPEDSQTTAEL